MVEAARGSNRQSRRLLTIPARPDYLVLARLALSAVCRLTPLSPEEIADLKLAITEAANDFVDDGRPLEDETPPELRLPPARRPPRDGARGPRQAPVAAMEQELSRAIIEATVDECQLRRAAARASSSTSPPPRAR